MKTKILLPTEAGIQEAARLLGDHQPVAFPTETVYGLAAKVFDPIGIQAIYDLKGRPSDNPLIVHISSIDQVALLAVDIPDDFYALAEAFFPGPLTVVLQRKHSVPPQVSANLNTVAVRMPSHPIALRLIEAAGEPLVAPSANVSGKPSPTTAEHVVDDLDGKVSAVIDGGSTLYGIESTVVDLTQGRPTILRPGSITPLQLTEVLRKEVVVSTDNSPQLAKSPGMKYRHYAPEATVAVFSRWEDYLTENRSYSTNHSLFLSNTQPPQSRFQPQIVHPLNAQTLFAEFRAADKEDIDQIVIILDETSQNELGLMNRIIKAARRS